VILTTGAVRALDPDQLDAVLAHERAHLAAHHHRLRAMARIGRQVLPFLPLMREADMQIARLVELHADDKATHARDPGALAAALVILATSASPAPALPRLLPMQSSGYTGCSGPPSRWAGSAINCYAPGSPPLR
jgi:Zn-dependent protease with chaperone function